MTAEARGRPWSDGMVIPGTEPSTRGTICGPNWLLILASSRSHGNLDHELAGLGVGQGPVTGVPGEEPGGGVVIAVPSADTVPEDVGHGLSLGQAVRTGHDEPAQGAVSL